MIVAVAPDIRSADLDSAFVVIFGLLIVLQPRPLFTAGSRDANG